MGNKIAGLRQKRGLVSDSIAAVVISRFPKHARCPEEEQAKVSASEAELKALDTTIAEVVRAPVCGSPLRSPGSGASRHKIHN